MVDGGGDFKEIVSGWEVLIDGLGVGPDIDP